MRANSRAAGHLWLCLPFCFLVVLASCGNGFAQSKCSVTIPIVVAPDEYHGGATKMSRNFEIRVDGIPVAPFSTKASPKRVALLLDVSASMRSRLDVAVSLATEIVKKLQPSDQVTFAAFASKEELSTGPTTDRNALLSSIQSASVPKGTKSLRTAMRNAIAQILGGDNHYDAMVLFTDGGDNASKTKDGALRKMVESSDVRIFAFLFVDDNFATPEEAQGSSAVKELVNLSGGIALLPWQWDWRQRGNPPRLNQASEKRVAASLELLTRAIDAPTMVSISWSGGVRLKGSNPFKIQVIDERGKKVDGDLVAYPHHISAGCVTTQAGAAAPASPN